MDVTGRGSRRRPGIRPATAACALLLVLAACWGQADRAPNTFDGSAVVTAEDDASTAAAVHAEHAAGAGGDEGAAEPRPVAVEIPAIGVHADLVGVGLNDDRSMQVPDFGLAGWYVEGPRPGAPGPAVIVAHYDSTDGPDVFHDLDSLTAGAEIHVHRADRSVATFVVDRLEQHPKEELPGDRIWAPSAEPRLSLITCGGVFDRATSHYTDNVIAYATVRERQVSRGGSRWTRGDSNP